MTREEAVRLIKSFAKSLSVETSGLNEKNFGGLSLGDAELYFEFHLPFFKDEPSLECSALIYKFHKEPDPRILEGFKAEEKAGTPTGGGEVDYEPENKGLFLSRSYKKVVDEAAFTEDMKKLVEASRQWGGEVLERVSTRVFHPEEAKR
jgi:hypothetical protein